MLTKSNNVLPKGKWFTYAVDMITKKARRYRELDFKDAYTYSRILSILGDEIKAMLGILEDRDSVLAEFHFSIAETLRSEFHFGRWPTDIIADVEKIIKLYDEGDNKEGA